MIPAMPAVTHRAARAAVLALSSLLALGLGEAAARLAAPFFLFDGEVVFKTRPYHGHEGVPMRSAGGVVLWHFPRADRPPVRPTKQGVRVVVLGDSVLFPAGVPDADGSARRLEALLNRHLDGGPYEVVNLAEPGFNTLQEERTLLEQGLSLRPDLVLLGVTPNDTQEFALHRGQLVEGRFLRHMIARAEARGFVARHSYLYNWLWLLGRRGWSSAGSARVDSDPLVEAPARRMATLLRARGVAFGVLCFPAYEGPSAQRLDPLRDRCAFPGLPRWASAEGVPLLDLVDAEAPFPSSALSIDPIHRSPLGHAVDAVAAFEWVVARRLVPYRAVRSRPSPPAPPAPEAAP